MPTILGDKIRRQRQKKGFSLDALATAAGMSKSYLWALETSDAANPTKDVLQKLALPLEVTPEFLANDGLLEATASEFQRAFFRDFLTLPPDKQRMLNGIMLILRG